ncbi:hypothetical protein [Paraburkholderia sp. BL9I2N2]|uniref:hypothetical protein n=1 Tax=Paraburkholderia sp. BL9I2N2 TaxID=1938809 RepID=UPI0010458FC7|nr:hypothetical protein [Paraburkholderia sp. BL9I2N2]TCK87318.1 hypothetical protein B0G74_7857 [Paraburkholderia sp. BL9I2N2]
MKTNQPEAEMRDNQRPDAEILRRKDDEHVSMLKARVGMGAVIMEGQEISAVARYIECLEQQTSLATSADQSASEGDDIPPPLTDSQRSHAHSFYMSLPHNWESGEAVIRKVAADAYVNGFQAAKSAAPAPVAPTERAAFEAACQKLAALPEDAHEKLFGNDDLDTWWALWKEARATSTRPVAALTGEQLDEIYLIAQDSRPLSEFKEEVRALLTTAEQSAAPQATRPVADAAVTAETGDKEQFE